MQFLGELHRRAASAAAVAVGRRLRKSLGTDLGLQRGKFGRIRVCALGGGCTA